RLTQPRGEIVAGHSKLWLDYNTVHPINVPAIFGRRRKLEAAHFAEEPVVSLCDADFVGDDLLDLFALNQAHCCLVTGDSKIVAGDFMSKSRSSKPEIC